MRRPTVTAFRFAAIGAIALCIKGSVYAVSPAELTMKPAVAEELAWHFLPRGVPPGGDCTVICADNPTHEIHAAPQPPDPEDAVNREGAGDHNYFASGMCDQ